MTISGGTFVGRARERAALFALLEAAERGSGGLAVITGEPGIGKTRLASEVTAVAAARGFRAGWGRAWESGGAPPFDPWTTALDAVGLPGPDVSTVRALDEEAARFQLYRATARALAGAGRVVLVLDDVHFADHSTLRMLHFVSRELAATHAVLVVTHRDRDPAMTADAESILGRVAREGLHIHLSRLTTEEVAALVRDVGPTVDAVRVSAIGEASGGNPLYASEIARLVEADPSLASLPLPASVRDVTRQRTARLSADARNALEIVATIGAIEGPRVMSAVLGPRGALLEPSIGAGVLVRDGERVRFAHALVRDAVLRDAGDERRRELHRHAADALAGMHDPPLVEIAHHVVEGRAEGPIAVARVAVAAHALTAALADEDAVHLLERAAGHLSSLELSIAAAQARARIGDAKGARGWAQRAVDEARRVGDANLLARAALAFAGEHVQGVTSEASRRLLEDAIARAPSPALRVQLEARLAASLQPARDPDAVADRALAAIAEARALGDERVLLDVLHDAGAAFGDAVFRPEVIDHGREAVRLAERLGDRAKLLRARARLVFACVTVGDLVAADAQIDAIDVEARATGQRRHLWWAPLLRAMRALMEGRFGDATSLLDEAAENAVTPQAQGAIYMHRFAQLRAKERNKEVAALESTLLRISGAWNDAEIYASLLVGMLRARAGDVEAARTHLDRVPLDSTAARARIARAGLADSALRVGHAALAAKLYPLLLPEGGRWSVFGLDGFAAELHYDRLLGGLADLIGRPDDADRYFASAIAAAEVASALPELARAHHAWGKSLAARGDSRARAHLDRARGLAARLELVFDAEAVAPPPSVAASEGGPSRAASSGKLTLVRDGETWILALGERSLRLRDSRGLAYLDRLFERPGQEIHVLELSGAGAGVDEGDAGEVLDERSRASYKRRIVDLDEELREAESFGDGARASRAKAEIELLSSELARAVGLGGRERRVGSAAERARVAVTRRIRDTLKRIAEQDATLGRHVEAAVRTGLFCTYRPIGPP